jgi:hypothetical protein
VVAPGADLALDLLDDDLAAATPSLKRALARHALTLLSTAPDEDLERRADLLYAVANSDSVVRAAADQAIDQARSGSDVQKMTAQLLLRRWRKKEGPLALRCRQIVEMQQVAKRRLEYRDRTYRWWEEEQETAEYNPHSRLEVISIELQLSKQESGRVAKLLDDIITEVGNSPAAENLKIPPGIGYQSSDVEGLLSNSGTANALGRLIIDLSNDRPVVALFIRLACRNWIKRDPVGTRVLELTPFPDPNGE